MNLFSRLKRRMSPATDQILKDRDPPQSSAFETLLPKNAELRNELREFIKQINNLGGSYHRLDFGDGMVMNGEYDMSKYIDNYGISKNLTGVSVLDIGTASGFFALESARRGALVTSIDVWNPDFYDRMREILGLNIHYIQKSIHDLDESFGKFDVIICGSLLLHLRDIFDAVERIYSVCKKEAIIATASIDDLPGDNRAFCEFIGEKTQGSAGAYWVYWHLNGVALKKMLIAAGFSEAYEIGKFVLTSEPGKSGFTVPHVVVKAIV